MRKFAAVAALASALLALPSVGCSAESPQDQAFGAKVRAYLLAHPEVLQEAMDKLQAKQEAEAAAVSQAAIGQSRAAIERDPRDPVSGNAAGRLTVTEFFDYRCPYCKASAPELPDVLERHPDVRFVYKEFPILSPESEQASRLALAAARQGKYDKVHLALMQAPRLDPPILDAILTQAGVDLARAKADAAGPAISAQIAATHKLATDIGVTGTPAFVIGDKIENGWSKATLEQDLAEAGSKPKS